MVESVRAKHLITVEEDEVSNHLRKFHIKKCMGPDGIYLKVLMKLINVIARPLLINFQKSWQSEEVPDDCL